MQEKFVIYTHSSQTRSRMVIGRLVALRKQGRDVPDDHTIETEDCPLVVRLKDDSLLSPEERKKEDKSVLVGVALVDANTSQFTMRHREKLSSNPFRLDVPGWAAPAKYVVFIGLGPLKGSSPNDVNIRFAVRRAGGCALQIAADFGRNLQARLKAKQLPWGQRRQSRPKDLRLKRLRRSFRGEAGCCAHSIYV